jgi:NitT/TauT family transport system substrate-binding protein
MTNACRSLRGARTLIFLCLAIVTGCPPAQAQTKLVVQAGNPVPNIGYSDLYVAIGAGFFKDEGLEIEIRHSTAASQAAQIVASGGADLGRLTFEPLFLGYEHGLRAKIFYQFYTHLIYYLAIPDESPIKTLQDLRGKSVGVLIKGGSGEIILRSMLQDAGIPVASVDIIPTGKGDSSLAAYHAGRIHAFLLWDEIYANMMSAGQKLRFIYHPTLKDVGNGGYLSTEKILKEKRGPLQGFARAIAKASVFIAANPRAASQIDLRLYPSLGTGIDEADSLKKMTAQIDYWRTNFELPLDSKTHGSINSEQLQGYANLLKAGGAIPSDVPVGTIADSSFVNEANNFDQSEVRELARNWK